MYGQSSMDRTREEKARNSEEVRGIARGVEGQKGLRRVGQIASQRESGPDRKPLPNVRTAAGLFAEIWLFPYDVPRSRAERADPGSDESQLVIL